LLALLDKEFLLEYFYDVPPEFMPEVLEFLQRNTQSNPSGYPLWQLSTSFSLEMEITPFLTLNMLYSCMRWWSMPSLYSFHRNVASGIKRKRNSGDD
jgi:hypothetical protein